MRLVSDKGLIATQAKPVIVPVVVLMSFVMVILALAFHLQCRALNSSAERAERAQLQQAVNHELASMAEGLEKTSLSYRAVREGTGMVRVADQLRRAAAAAQNGPAFDHIFEIRDGKVLVSVSTGNTIEPVKYEIFEPWVDAALTSPVADDGAGLRGTLEAAGLRSGSHDARTARQFVAFDDADGYFVTLQGQSGGEVASDHTLLVGIKRLSDDFLQHISVDANVNALKHVRAAEPDSAVFKIDALAFGKIEPAFAWVPRRPGDAFLSHVSANMVIFIALFAALVALRTRSVMTDLSKSEASARRSAGHDQLSGLPNRLLFSEILDHEIAQQAQSGSGFALFYIDIDRFKEINDALGHDAGDEMIREVTRRVRAVLPRTDVIARIGGDEFAILARSARDEDACRRLADVVLGEMRAPFALLHGQSKGCLSVGIARYPVHADIRQDLMRKSDIALYRAKQGGRNRYIIYEDSMDAGLREAKKLEDELRLALVRNALAVHYQPVMTGDGQRIAGVEALVRWPNAELGFIMPDRFIPLAEERGLIFALGEFVLRRAMLDGLKWPGLRVAVNVSPVQFRAWDFVSKVKTCLAETGFDPARLEIELTEGVLVDNPEQAAAAMAELRALGVRMALDDFGTGYSSLIYLRRFPFDKIKIDRAFLRELELTGEGAIIVHSVVHLGRALGLTVTAEGVETPEQQRFLQAAGCHELQGYHFSTAQTADAISRLVRPDQGERVAPVRLVA